MFFTARHAPVPDLALGYSFLCSVLITLRVSSRRAIPRSSTLRLHEQSRAPSLGEVYGGPRLKRYYSPLRLPSRPAPTSLPYTPRLTVSPPPEWISSTGQSIFEYMPTLLPR